MCVLSLRHVQLFETPWTVACQAPLSILKNDFGQLTSELPSFYKKLVSEVGGILPQESLKRIQTDFEKGQPIEAADEVQRALQSAENATLNVAVIGQSGSGKSSFINVLQGIHVNYKSSQE